ncbi:hypothetical protein [Paraburkholderia sp. SIMBA_054]|uniref:hypothetical protein n=1 Tax=Paraburkholderia sp. SIMBA_054 TaxID=3085795 RepID=UPI003978E4EF
MNMSDSNALQQQVKEITAVKGSSGRKFGPCTPASVLSFLYERAKGLNAEELKFLSGSSQAACFMASQLGGAVSNIGCLIDNDANPAPGALRAGNFELGDNVAQLLFSIADQVNIISELVHIGSECDFSLRQMGVESV